MKKLLIALVLSCLVVLGLAMAVAADNGPHGSFTATTDACASCHRAHSAQYGSNALLIANPEALCMSCHDGTGAGTNVHDGVYSQAGANTYYGTAPAATVEGVDGGSLLAGGFINTLMATAWSGAATANPAFNAVSRPTTSQHAIDVSGTIWGSGAPNSVAGTMTLECTSCHDPHGTAGWNTAVTPAVRTASYRLLRFQPSGSDGFTPPPGVVNWSGGAFPSNGTITGWTVPDNFAASGTEWYTIGTKSTTGTPATAVVSAFAVGDYMAGNGSHVYNQTNDTSGKNYGPAALGTSYFCAQCHDRYFTNSALRTATDDSLYCGSPVNGTTVVGTATLPHRPDADGVAPWIHPVDPDRCAPALSAVGALVGWDDYGGTTDTTYKFMHTSGDYRASADGTRAADTRSNGANIGRSCVACHVAHGTSAQMTAFASDATVSAVAGADVNNSNLLRLDNRSVCLRCHATTVNFTVAP